MRTLDDILGAADAWKPSGYDEEVKRRRAHYQNKAMDYILKRLKSRNKNSWAQMTPFSIGLYRHLVEQMSTCYRVSPRREADGAQELVDGIYRDGMVDSSMQHVEQVSAAAGLCFVRVVWNSYDECIELRHWWPDSVGVIPHPDWPTRLDYALAIVAGMSGTESLKSDVQRFEVWTRNGTVWNLDIRTSDGKSVSPLESDGPLSYEFLPWVAMHFDSSPTTMFQIDGTDDLDSIENICCLFTELHYTVAMQSHTQLTYQGSKDPGQLVGGPGAVWHGGEDGQFNAINYAPQITQVQGAIDDTIGRLLVTKGVSPASASADPTYQSGVALKVQNAPMLEHREARIPHIRRIEERHLWRAIKGVWNHHTTADRIPDDQRLTWYPGELMVPLDDEAAFRLSAERVANDVSTWPAEMVVLGRAENLAQAREMFEANKAYNKSGAADAETNAAAAPGEVGSEPTDTAGLDEIRR